MINNSYSTVVVWVTLYLRSRGNVSLSVVENYIEVPIKIVGLNDIYNLTL